MSRTDTARTILAAARLLLEEGGARAVSMRKVAERVGVTAMAIYRHYPDHRALLNALADEGFAEMSQALLTRVSPGPLLERMEQVIEVHLDFGLAHPHLFELMFLSSRSGARQFPQDFSAGLSPTANQFAEMLREGAEAGLIRPGEDVWEITFETGALIQGLLILYLGGRIGLAPEDFRALVRRSLRRYIHGILA